MAGTYSRIGSTSSWSVLALLLVCGADKALAQPAPPDPVDATPATSEDAPPDTGVVDANDTTAGEILIVGTRASQQSAIDRKKNARTATDSIVADDIGSFPDRNVAEAISRVPGVALGRNEFGEGESVAVRGNGPDLTRVELDGIGMMSTN